jgi:hypothetical protein
LGTDDIMSRLHAEEQAHERSLDHVDAQAAAAWAEQRATIGSTKWIAQEMKLEENEASLVLEEEMQRALAAIQMEAEAQAEAAQDLQVEPFPSIEDTAAEAGFEASPPVEALSSLELSETLAEESVAEAATVEVQEQFNSYAAAASAGVSPAPVPVYADSPGHVTSPVESISEPESRPADPELAEAWARWRQIRESVASPQFVSQVADVAAAELQHAQQQDAASTPVPTAPAVPDANAIASIVDSVLAQLKPKLVEEIARQLTEKK